MFYLEHQDRIDEWAALRKTVRGRAHTFFSDLAAPLQRRCGELPGRPFLHVSLEEGCPKLFFALPAWRTADGKNLKAGIGLEWEKAGVDFRSSYSGAWVDRRLDGSAALAVAIREGLKPLVAGRGYEHSRWWPASHVEKPTREDYWLDFDGFADELVDRICARWRLMYELVDEAVAASSIRP